MRLDQFKSQMVNDMKKLLAAFPGFRGGVGASGVRVACVHIREQECFEQQWSGPGAEARKPAAQFS